MATADEREEEDHDERRRVGADEDRRSLQWSRPAEQPEAGEDPGGEQAESEDADAAQPTAEALPDHPNVEAHVASEGMAVGTESGEDYSPDGRRADLRASVPGARFPGAHEPLAEGGGEPAAGKRADEERGDDGD